MPKSLYWAVVSIVVMVVGAFGPWASVNLGKGLTINGTDEGKDGWIVVGAAGVAVVLLAIFALTRRRWLFWLVLVAAALAAGVAGYDIGDIESTFGEGRLVDTEWGIYVALIGSISLALAAIAGFFETKRRPATIAA